MIPLKRSVSCPDLSQLTFTASAPDVESLRERVQELIESFRALVARFFTAMPPERKLSEDLKRQIWLRPIHQELKSVYQSRQIDRIQRAVNEILPEQGTLVLAAALYKAANSPIGESEFPACAAEGNTTTLYIADPGAEKGEGTFKRVVRAVALHFSACGRFLGADAKVQLAKKEGGRATKRGEGEKKGKFVALLEHEHNKLLQLWARVKSPNVVSPYEFIVGEGDDAVAFMPDEGESLIDCRERLSTAEKLTALARAAKGLRDIHKVGFVACDVKLENIFHGETTKLADPVLKSEDEAKQTGASGTRRIWPPEFGETNRKHNTSAADVYALAISAYKLFEGDYPVILRVKSAGGLRNAWKELSRRAGGEDGWDSDANRTHIFGVDPTIPEGMSEEVYQKWQVLIMNGIHPDPDKRSSAETFASELEQLGKSLFLDCRPANLVGRGEELIVAN